MTNILDDDYESDLTEEEHNELVLMSGHAVGPPLSPGTTAVLQAYLSTHLSINNLAAALRAVADYVTPWKPEPTEESVGPTIDYGYAWALFSKANDIRQELIAIADELESL